jgi:branched-subunit amino acid aminotransferase/4-amino-4-deoxychorismate lyase
MIGQVFWKNGQLRPLAEGTVPIDDVNFAYGYGVYETLKTRGGILYFPEWHVERLLHSAVVIGLRHDFSAEAIQRGLADLVKANGVKDSNLKVLLIGQNGPGADLYLMQLNPLFPKRHDYKHGARAVLFRGERQYPEAKSLNMLVSTMAFRQAREHEAYDSILVNRDGHLTEGTRTNLFYTDGTTFFTPPVHEVLAGVTRRTVIECIGDQGWPLVERPLDLSEMRGGQWAGVFLTSTSTKVMPITALVPPADEPEEPPITLGIPAIVPELMKAYDAWLERYRLTQPVLVD